MPIVGKFALRLRYLCAKHMFSRCDGFVNLEQGAHIGSGKNFYVGKDVGIGKEFICHNRIVTIHDGLLMGENVLFQGGHTRSQIQISQLVQNPMKSQPH